MGSQREMVEDLAGRLRSVQHENNVKQTRNMSNGRNGEWLSFTLDHEETEQIEALR